MKKHTIYRIALLPVIIFTFQSCFTAKNYTRPEVVDEKNFRMNNPAADSSNIEAISWNEFFTDPQLLEYIDEALQNNIDIRIALQQIEAAEAYYRQGKASYFPTLNANAQVAHQQFSENVQGGGDVTQFNLSGTLSWEADIWGKIRSSARASEASYLQTIAAHQAVKTELIADIASIYFQLLSLDEQVRITQQTIQNRKNSLNTTRSLKDAGYITEAGIEQTEAQLYNAQAILIDLEMNIKLLENTFSILLGRSPESIERTSLDQQQVGTEINIGFPAQLLRNRPDVIAAEYNLINAFELSNVARSNFYPSINISATGGLQSLQLDELFSLKSWFSNTIGTLTQPIFNARQVRSQYEVAKSQEEQAYLNFRWSILNASREVSNALYTYEASGKRIAVKRAEYEAYDTATRYSEELLNNGLVNYLEVLSARENALNSQLSLIDAQFSQLNASVELYRALGGGWRF